jgi:hypothetical protein
MKSRGRRRGPAVEITGKSKKLCEERRIGEQPHCPKLASEKCGLSFGHLVGESARSKDWVIITKIEKPTTIVSLLKMLLDELCSVELFILLIWWAVCQ